MLPKDPMILFSYVNTKLRDEYNSLEELCASEDVNQESLLETLAAVGFTYQPDSNQFS